MSSPTQSAARSIRRLIESSKRSGFQRYFALMARMWHASRFLREFTTSESGWIISTERKICGTMAQLFTQFDCGSAARTHLRLNDFAASHWQINPLADVADRPTLARAHGVDSVEIGKLQRATRQRRSNARVAKLFDDRRLPCEPDRGGGDRQRCDDACRSATARSKTFCIF